MNNQKVADLRRHLLTGVSYMLPFVVSGGLLLTIGLLTKGSFMNEISEKLIKIGVLVFGIIVPIVAGYIAFSISDRPGLVVGMAGGLVANEIGAGFLGGIVAGLLAGYITNVLKKMPVNKHFVQLKPLMFIPVLGVAITSLLMYYVIGVPIVGLTNQLKGFLTNLSGSNLFVLGLIIGAMMAFDMGGPVNKVAFAFCIGALQDGLYAPMAACWIGIMTPPIGIGLATLIAPKKFTNNERASAISATIMGATGITEGAIPFAIADPAKVITSLVIGSAVGGGLALALGVQSSIPSGGVFVIPFFTNPFGFVIAFAVAIIVTAMMLVALKKEVNEEQ